MVSIKYFVRRNAWNGLRRVKMFNEIVGMTEMVEVVGIFRKSEMVGMVGIV